MNEFLEEKFEDIKDRITESKKNIADQYKKSTRTIKNKLKFKGLRKSIKNNLNKIKLNISKVVDQFRVQNKTLALPAKQEKTGTTNISKKKVTKKATTKKKATKKATTKKKATKKATTKKATTKKKTSKTTAKKKATKASKKKSSAA